MRYNTPTTPLDNLKDFMTRGGIPVTMTLLCVNVVTFLAAFFSQETVMPFLQSEMAFNLSNFFHAPWTLFTYPLIALPPFSLRLVITWVFFWLSGGSLERSWGSQRYALFFLFVTLFTSASLLGGGLILRQDTPPLDDIFLPLTGLLVAFCMLNPEQEVGIFLLPVRIRAKYVAIGITLWTYFSYGSMLGPKLGFFALGGILAAFLYVRFARPWGDISSYSAPRRAPRGPDLRMDTRPSTPAGRQSFRTTRDGSPLRPKPFDIAGRIRDWRDRRKLEKLWRNSGLSDSEPEWRDDEKRRR